MTPRRTWKGTSMPGGEGGHSDMYVPSLPQTQTHPPTAARAKYELRCAAPAQGCGRGGGPGRTCAEHVGAEAGWWWCVVRVQRLPPRQVHVRPTSPRDTESCRRALSVSSSLHLAAPTDQVRAEGAGTPSRRCPTASSSSVCWWVVVLPWASPSPSALSTSSCGRRAKTNPFQGLGARTCHSCC